MPLWQHRSGCSEVAKEPRRGELALLNQNWLSTVCIVGRIERPSAGVVDRSFAGANTRVTPNLLSDPSNLEDRNSVGASARVTSHDNAVEEVVVGRSRNERRSCYNSQRP
eukprot:8310005-Pyramimonas_sp.AAC.1